MCFKAHNENENERSWWDCECTAYGLMHDKSKIHAPKRQHKTRKISQFKCIATILRRISYYYFLYGDNESHMSLSPSQSFLFFFYFSQSICGYYWIGALWAPNTHIAEQIVITEFQHFCRCFVPFFSFLFNEYARHFFDRCAITPCVWSLLHRTETEFVCLHRSLENELLASL